MLLVIKRLLVKKSQREHCHVLVCSSETRYFNHPALGRSLKCIYTYIAEIEAEVLKGCIVQKKSIGNQKKSLASNKM